MASEPIWPAVPESVQGSIARTSSASTLMCRCAAPLQARTHALVSLLGHRQSMSELHQLKQTVDIRGGMQVEGRGPTQVSAERGFAFAHSDLLDMGWKHRHATGELGLRDPELRPARRQVATKRGFLGHALTILARRASLA
jgi:hypothetical protein